MGVVTVEVLTHILLDGVMMTNAFTEDFLSAATLVTDELSYSGDEDALDYWKLDDKPQ